MIVVLDGEPYIDVHIAHIYDALEGNRFRIDMTDDERRSFSNLVLLCKPHHDLVDKRHPERYPPEVLTSWKKEREGSDIPAEDLADLDEDILEAALLEVTVINIRDGGLYVGGTGGSAPGAGGGGGGVIGSGTGGPGGSGGPGGPGARAYIADDADISVDGTDGVFPGAGGGGGGALNDGVLFRHAQPGEAVEGLGTSSGLDGQAGQASSFGTPGSETYIEAPGGAAGLAGAEPRLASDALALALSTIMLANSVEIRDDLYYLLGAGWQSLEVLNLGNHVNLAIVLTFEAGGLAVGDYTVSVAIEDPSGATATNVQFPISVRVPGDVVRILRWVPVEFEVSEFGRWRILITSGAKALGTLDLVIKRLGVATAPSYDLANSPAPTADTRTLQAP